MLLRAQIRDAAFLPESRLQGMELTFIFVRPSFCHATFLPESRLHGMELTFILVRPSFMETQFMDGIYISGCDFQFHPGYLRPFMKIIKYINIQYIEIVIKQFEFFVGIVSIEL